MNDDEHAPIELTAVEVECLRNIAGMIFGAPRSAWEFWTPSDSGVIAKMLKEPLVPSRATLLAGRDR